MVRRVKIFEERLSPLGQLISESIEIQLEKWKAEEDNYVLQERYNTWVEGAELVTCLAVTYAPISQYHRLGLNPEVVTYGVRDGMEEAVYRDIIRKLYKGAGKGSVQGRVMFMAESPLAGLYAPGYPVLVKQGYWSVTESSFLTVVADNVLSCDPEPAETVKQAFRALSVGGVFLAIEKCIGPADEVLRRYTPAGLRAALASFRDVRVYTLGNWSTTGRILASGGYWPPTTEKEATRLLSRTGERWPTYAWAIGVK